MKRKLNCVVCGTEFDFDESEQGMYLEHGFPFEPKRCKACRGSMKAMRSAIKPPKETFTAVCDACGKETQLPFKPKGDKPVYCRECFSQHK